MYIQIYTINSECNYSYDQCENTDGISEIDNPLVTRKSVSIKMQMKLGFRSNQDDRKVPLPVMFYA